MEEMRRSSQMYACFGRLPELRLLIDLLRPLTELRNFRVQFKCVSDVAVSHTDEPSENRTRAELDIGRNFRLL